MIPRVELAGWCGEQSEVRRGGQSSSSRKSFLFELHQPLRLAIFWCPTPPENRQNEYYLCSPEPGLSRARAGL